MATDSTTLKCGACGHENEPERVYCHSCGQKLDRSLLPKREPQKQEYDLDKRRKQIQKMMRAGRGNFRRELKTGVTLLVLAAVVAAVYLFWQKPDGVPPGKVDTLPDRDAGELWERMVAAPNAVTITFSELELNAYLRRSVKPAGGTIPGVEFKRAFVKLEPDVLTLTVERDAWGLSMYTSVSYRLMKDGQFAPEVVGVRYGRLPVHPVAKIAGELSISGVLKAFEKEKAGLPRIAEARVIQGAITVVTKPAQ